MIRCCMLILSVFPREKGSMTFEYALFVTAATIFAVITLPIFFRQFGGYLGGFHE